MNRFLVTLVVNLFFGLSFAQIADNVEYIVAVKATVPITQVLKDYADCPLHWRTVDQDYHIYVVKGNCLKPEVLDQDVNIVSWQKNKMNSLRNTYPNDSAFSSQTSLEIIEMPSAWDVSIGGRTASGKKIVIAVIDELFAVNHPDLVDNLYVNKNEVPNDGIDNDGNGYTDDYIGYNAKTDNDDHRTGGNWHGTAVAGIMGARGNNSLGIAGINWDAQLLLLSPVITTDDVIIRNLIYTYKLRKKYNESQGIEGAYVVVANMSFGADGQREEDFAMLSSWLDSLGQVGVITVGAGPNADVDIDANGDKPCASDCPHLITVTNTDAHDRKVSAAGYGLINMDVAAPGEAAYSTYRTDSYRPFTGCSSAAPHVSGLVALLYSLSCPSFEAMVQNDPAGAASKVRQVILECGDDLGDLQGITATGKRINAYKAMQLFQKQVCVGSESEEKINYISTTEGSPEILIDFTLPGLDDYRYHIYDMAGRKIRDRLLPKSIDPHRQMFLDVSTWPNATYAFSIIHEDGKILDSRSFVVVK